jgi:tRNA threonylcarbamoyladenosine biosynthesis protein TsaE
MTAFFAATPRETARLGQLLAESTVGRLVVELVGDLGMGKTCFAQGVGDGLGVRVPVVSPTFILMAEYDGWRPLLHIDAWRMDAEEADAVGLRDAVADWSGVVLVEWADRVSALLPEDRLPGGGRELRVSAWGPDSDQALSRWSRAVDG